MSEFANLDIVCNE